jgi:hypothetical protein
VEDDRAFRGRGACHARIVTCAGATVAQKRNRHPLRARAPNLDGFTLLRTVSMVFL